MKKIILISALIFFLGNISLHAHSGRTDASGGHNCSEKSIRKGLCSGYHYHSSAMDNTLRSLRVEPDSPRERLLKDIKPKNERDNEVDQAKSNNEIFRLLLNSSNKQFKEFNNLYSSVEEELTKLSCVGKSETKSYSYGVEIGEESEPQSFTFISFNESYLFLNLSTSPNQWLLIGEKKNNQMINLFPTRSQLSFNDSLISWTIGTQSFPFGKKNISKLLGLNTDWISWMSGAGFSFSINRSNANFYNEFRAGAVFPNAEMDDFDFITKVNGSCSVITEKMF